IPYPGRKGFWFQMKWDGREHIEGGYSLSGGEDQTVYAPSVKMAPILRPTPLGPLSFICFQAEAERGLTIGKAADIQLGVGSAGSGPDTFCVLSERFLTPGKDVIVATLIAKDREGKELRSQTEFKRHC